MRSTDYSKEPKCIYCGEPLRWINDYTAEEYGWHQGDGIITEYDCDNCKAEYVVYIPSKDGSEEN